MATYHDHDIHVLGAKIRLSVRYNEFKSLKVMEGAPTLEGRVLMKEGETCYFWNGADEDTATFKQKIVMEATKAVMDKNGMLDKEVADSCNCEENSY